MNIDFSMRKAARAALLCGAVLGLAGCIEAGGQQLSLLPSSKLLDPLEVPPGLSPLPVAEQLQLPQEHDASQIDYASIPPEQFRNYEAWASFEKFQEYKSQQEAEQLNVERYEAAKAKGEGHFRVQIQPRSDESVQLQIYDDFGSVWPRLERVLNDMGVDIRGSNRETGVYYVLNIYTKEKPSLSERIGIREYRGRIDELHLSGSEDGAVTYVLPKTVDGATVKESAARDFYTRLRYFLLTNYQLDEAQVEPQLASLRTARYMDGEGGERSVLVDLDFSTAWVQLGRTFEASGVDIDDLDRSAGLYIVSFRSTEKSKGRRWWAFWRGNKDRDIKDQQFNVIVTESGGGTQIQVSPKGVLDETSAEAAQSLLAVIYERIES